MGSKVEKFKVGDKVGVGAWLDHAALAIAVRTISRITVQKWYSLTYGARYHDGTVTYGGYSDSMVADEHFIVRIPDNLPPDAGAPLLYYGISKYGMS